MTVCQTPCENCDRKGLPILFTRYAAAYSADQRKLLEGFMPAGHLQAKPGGIALGATNYVVRMLRRGYLYVLVERKGGKTWTGYRVHPHGYLQEFIIGGEPKDEQKKPCDPEVRGANASMVMVPHAKGVKNLWYLFHPDPVPFKKLDELKGKPASLQHFDVAGWANGKDVQSDSSKPDRLQTQVIEWGALSSAPLQDVMRGQLYGLMGVTAAEQEWGPQVVIRDIPTPVNEPYGLSNDVMVPHAFTDPGLAFATAHGKRLANIEKRLAAERGVVLACNDPIGIVQELAHAYVPATGPYLDWLTQTDANKVSNEWKFHTSRMIGLIQGALSKGAAAQMKDRVGRANQVEHNRKKIEMLGRADRQGRISVRQSDGSVTTMTVEDYMEKWRKAREQSAETMSEAEGKSAIDKSKDLYNDDERLKFEKQHLAEGLMPQMERFGAIGKDHAAWLNAKPFLENALGLYGRRYESTGMSAKEIGTNFMVQVGQCLQGVENSLAGRQYLVQCKLLEDSDKNLLLTAISTNDPEIRSQISRELEGLTSVIPAAGNLTYESTNLAAAQQAIAKAENWLKNVKNVVSGFNELIDRFSDKPIQNSAAACLLNLIGIRANLSGVSSTGIARLAQAQVLSLAFGLGDKAADFLNKRSKEIYAAGVRRNGALLTPRKPLFDAGDIQNYIKKAASPYVRGAAARARVTLAISVFECAGLVTSLRKATVTNGGREWLETGAQFSTVVGSIYGYRTKLYEKTMAPALSSLDASEGAFLENIVSKQLRGRRLVGGMLLTAGSAVGAWYDYQDGVSNLKDSEKLLACMFFVRFAGGVGGIVASSGLVFVLEGALSTWLGRINIYSFVISTIVTIAIIIFDPKKYVVWLQSCVFQFQDKSKYKTRHKNADETYRKFAEVAIEIDMKK
ncbi:T6SS effector BTH_I2691 family protein [Cupriavidus basilensis]